MTMSPTSLIFYGEPQIQLLRPCSGNEISQGFPSAGHFSGDDLSSHFETARFILKPLHRAHLLFLIVTTRHPNLAPNVL